MEVGFKGNPNIGMWCLIKLRTLLTLELLQVNSLMEIAFIISSIFGGTVQVVSIIVKDTPNWQ